MKDYYKILGVKSTASREEIHARWIELMRRFHPDRGDYEALEDERAREINEAYGVLKDSYSRSEYDLRRAYQRKKKSLYLQRMITPPAVCICLLILGLVYLQWPRPSRVRPAKSSLPSIHGFIHNKTNPPFNEINQINQTNETDQIDQTSQRKEANETDQINKKDKTNEINPTTKKDQIAHPKSVPSSAKSGKSKTAPRSSPRTDSKKSKVKSNDPNKTVQIGKTNAINQTNKTNVSREGKPSPLFARAETSVAVKKAPPLPSESSQAKKLTNTSQPNEINETNLTNEINDPNALDALNQTNQTNKVDSTNQVNPINPQNLVNQTDEINQKNRIAQLNQLSPAITEEDVNQFLQLYKKHYIHQDIGGLISLFSPKALQNGRDGINEIKKMYSDFFHQSHELGYQLKNTKIAIYHEALIHGLFYEYAVAVEAHYQIDQTLIKKGEKKVWRGDIRWILVTENGALKVLQLDFKPEKSP